LTDSPPRRPVCCTQPTSAGAAAVFAVRFLGRVGNHVGLHLLHLAATGEELLHRLGQGITLFLLGFDARQFFHLDRFGLALLAASYDFCAVVVASVAIIGSRQLLAVVLICPFQIILFQVFVYRSAVAARRHVTARAPRTIRDLSLDGAPVGWRAALGYLAAAAARAALATPLARWLASGSRRRFDEALQVADAAGRALFV